MVCKSWKGELTRKNKDLKWEYSQFNSQDEQKDNEEELTRKLSLSRISQSAVSWRIQNHCVRSCEGIWLNRRKRFIKRSLGFHTYMWSYELYFDIGWAWWKNKREETLGGNTQEENTGGYWANSWWNLWHVSPRRVTLQ